MNLRCRQLATITLATLAFTAASAHARFEPLVQATATAGEVLVTEPGAKKPSPVEQDKAYPYGSSFSTADDSSLTLQFSDGNTCKLLPNSTAKFTQNKRRGKVKTVQMVIGKIELQLSADLADNNEQVLVRAPASTVTGIDCHFRVDAAADGEHRVVVIRAIRGSATVNGDYLSVRALPQDASMSIYSPADMSYLRVVNIKGEFPVVVREEGGVERPIGTTAGSVVKVWRRPVPDSTQVMVAVMLTNAKGGAIGFKDESGNLIGNTVTGVYGAGETLSGAPLTSPAADGRGPATNPDDATNTGGEQPQDDGEPQPENEQTPSAPSDRRNPEGPFPRDFNSDLQRLLGTTTTQYIRGVTPVGDF